MLNYLIPKEIVAPFAKGLLAISELNWQSITFIPQVEKSEVFFVRTVIDTSSEDIVKAWVHHYYGLQPITLTENTQDG